MIHFNPTVILPTPLIDMINYQLRNPGFEFDQVDQVTAERGDRTAVLMDEFACNGLFHNLLHLIENHEINHRGQLINVSLIQFSVNRSNSVS